MFDFSANRHRRQIEAIVPMISVSFLLLVFFLVGEKLALSADGSAHPILWVNEAGHVKYGDHFGEAAMTALDNTPVVELTMIVHPELEANYVARLLGRLTSLGLTRVSLSVGSEPGK